MLVCLLMMSWLEEGGTVVVLTSQGEAIVVTKMRIACGAARVTSGQTSRDKTSK